MLHSKHILLAQFFVLTCIQARNLLPLQEFIFNEYKACLLFQHVGLEADGQKLKKAVEKVIKTQNGKSLSYL